MIDFAQLKQDISIEQVAILLGLEVKPDGKQLRAPCPACKKGGDRALVITPEKGVFYCFADKKGGDLISLTAHIRGCSIKEAGAFLSGDKPASVPENKSGAERKGFDPASYIAKLDVEHELVTALGLTPELCKEIGMGFCNTGVHRGRLAIPLRKADGTIVVFVSVGEDLKLPPKWSTSQ